MHAENGFLKVFPKDDGAHKVQASFSHPFGMNEFEFGQFDSENQITLIAD